MRCGWAPVFAADHCHRAWSIGNYQVKCLDQQDIALVICGVCTAMCASIWLVFVYPNAVGFDVGQCMACLKEASRPVESAAA